MEATLRRMKELMKQLGTSMTTKQRRRSRHMTLLLMKMRKQTLMPSQRMIQKKMLKLRRMRLLQKRRQMRLQRKPMRLRPRPGLIDR